LRIITLFSIAFIDQMKDKVADERPTLDEVLEYNWSRYDG